MKILVLITIISLQICKLAASAPPAMVSEAEERADLSRSLVQAARLPDPLEGKFFAIDPRTFSGTQNFPFKSKNGNEGFIGAIGIRNNGGVLEVFNTGIPFNRIEEIASKNLANGTVEQMPNVLDLDDWFRIVHVEEDSDRTLYSGLCKATSRESVQISSTQGFDFCNALFLGNTPLIFKQRGNHPSPFFGLVVEAYDPGEYSNSILNSRGGAMVSGTLDFSKPMGLEYVKGNFGLTITDPRGDSTVSCFLVLAKSVTFIVNGCGTQVPAATNPASVAAEAELG